MKKSDFKPWLYALFILSMLIGCAAHRPFWGDEQSGFTLRYRLAADATPAYTMLNKVDQQLDIMGQSMATTVDSYIGFHLQNDGHSGESLKLKVTVDSSATTMTSMQGDAQPDMSRLWGKSFTMMLSALGKEKIEGSADLFYTMGQAERNLTTSFQAIFPDLSGRPIKIGESWTTRDTIRVQEGDNDIMLTFIIENKLAGIEASDGHECVKVIATSTGKLTGTGYQNGADLVFDGSIESNEEWFFAYKEGMLVRHTSDAKTKSEIKVMGPSEMTIPMTMTTKTETKLAS